MEELVVEELRQLDVAEAARTNVKPLDNAAGKKLRKLDVAFKHFRSAEDTMPIGVAHALVAVGLNEGASLNELSRKFNISLSNLSRYLLTLSDRSRTGGPGSGLGLIVREQDPTNLRQNSYRLSDKGRVFFHELIEKL